MTAVRPAPATLNAIQRVLFGLGGLCERILAKRPRTGVSGTYNIARNLAVMQAFATLTDQRNVFVTKDVIDQLIHRWLFKLATGTSLAAESGRPLDLLVQKFPNI